MTVSSLLAGFVLTALSAVLVVGQRPWPWDRVAAVIALSTSLLLFLASVYIYDQLSTPSGFWTDAAPPRLFWKRLYEARDGRFERLWNKTWDSTTGDEDRKGRQADDVAQIHRGPP